MNFKLVILLSIVFLLFSSRVVTDQMLNLLPPRFSEREVIILLAKTTAFTLFTMTLFYFYKIDQNIIRVPYTQVKVNPNPNDNHSFTKDDDEHQQHSD